MKKIYGIVAAIGMAVLSFGADKVQAYDGKQKSVSYNLYIDGNSFGPEYADYEFDYGLVNFYAQTPASTAADTYNLSGVQPPVINDIFRYDHWSSVHPNGDRGWTLDMSKREWANPDTGRVELEGDYGGHKAENAFVKGAPLYYITDNNGIMFDSPSRIPHRYMRWSVFWYYRQKSMPKLGNSYIEFSSNGPKVNTYKDYDILWAQPNKTSFKSWSADYYNSSYGQYAQYDGDIMGVQLLIKGGGINFAKNVDINSWVSNLMTYDNNAQEDSKVYFSSFGVNDLVIGSDGMEHNIMGGKAEFNAEDGADYIMMANAYNKWGRFLQTSSEYYNGIDFENTPSGVSWFNGFRLNSAADTDVYKQYKIDGQGPVWDGDPVIKNSDEYGREDSSLEKNVVIDGMKINIKNLHDVRGNNKDLKGVGVDYTESKDNISDKQYVVIYKADKNGNSVEEGEKLYTYGGDSDGSSDLEFEINFNKSRFKDYYGDLNVQFISYDLLGNVSRSRVIKVKKINPIPEVGQLSVVKYDYKESNDTYWVKLGNDFGIYTEGYFNKNYGIYPTSTILSLLENNLTTNKYVTHSMDKDFYDYKGDNYLQDVYIDDKDINKYKSFVSDTLRNIIGNHAFKYQDNKLSRNYLKGVHWLSTEEHWNDEEKIDDGRAFRLYSEAEYKYSRFIYDYETEEYSTIYKGDRKDSGLWIKIDGTAPTGKVTMTQDIETTDISVNVSDVKDFCTGKKINGSGVKRIFAKFYPKLADDYSGSDQYYSEGNSKQYVLQDLKYDSVSNSWSGNIDAYSAFGCDDITVQIYGEDNVGNIGLIKEETFPLLTLTAKVVPYNDPDCTEEVPTIEEGQYARLKMKTTGGPTKLVINFDYEIESYVAEGEDALSTVIEIPSERSRETEYIFKVPLYVPDKKYNINVQAIKKRNSKEADTQFKVSKNVLDNLRTRLR